MADYLLNVLQDSTIYVYTSMSTWFFYTEYGSRWFGMLNMCSYHVWIEQSIYWRPFLMMSYKVVKFCEEKLVSGINEYGACDVSSIALLQSIIGLLLWVNGCPNSKYTTYFRLHTSVCYNLFLSYVFSCSIVCMHIGRHKLMLAGCLRSRKG